MIGLKGYKPFTLGWIIAIPKTIDINGCWIPTSPNKNSSGYSIINISKRRYILSRLSICIYLGLNYNGNFEARHSKGCSKRCFNYMHITPGSHRDNIIDMINHAEKINCPHCGRKYTTFKRKWTTNGGPTWERTCTICVSRKRKTKRKLHSVEEVR